MIIHNPTMWNTRLLFNNMYIPPRIIKLDKTINIFDELTLFFAPLIELINKVIPLNKIHAPIIILIKASIALEKAINVKPKAKAINPILKSLIDVS